MILSKMHVSSQQQDFTHNKTPAKTFTPPVRRKWQQKMDLHNKNYIINE